MTPISCKDCSSRMDAADAACPQCGAVRKKGNPPAVWIVVVLIFIGFVSTLTTTPSMRPPAVDAAVPAMPTLPSMQKVSIADSDALPQESNDKYTVIHTKVTPEYSYHFELLAFSVVQNKWNEAWTEVVHTPQNSLSKPMEALTEAIGHIRETHYKTCVAKINAPFAQGAELAYSAMLRFQKDPNDKFSEFAAAKTKMAETNTQKEACDVEVAALMKKANLPSEFDGVH